ncbi:porin [Bordetella genomosp. 5]|uniref:Porin n=1 Tax=Bordetella genomosp. 5 TaxID=1395608 RepID=A0A261TAR6_9BORD|nr:porin [Bordetella genomosp. 5]OZI46724.1 porin [Bordetella genomosp. 5]
MKKTLLSAAVLALMAGAAHADSSVTLYGILDTGLGYQKIKGAKNAEESKFGMVSGVSSGSRWGLRGAEDLGDGLSAVFTLESGFNSTTGTMGQTGRLFGRQATVGLKSNAWGQLDFGRQTNIASKYFAAIDPFGAGYGQANYGQVFSSANTVRYDNMVMYQTPSFSGFQAGIGYSFSIDEQNLQPGYATMDNARAFTAGLRYVNGPVAVALSYDQLNPSHKTSVADVKPNAWIVGGAYDFTVVKVSLAYGQTRDGWFAGQALSPFSAKSQFPSYSSFSVSDRYKVQSFLVGLSAPVGRAGNLMTSWQHGRIDRSDNDIDVLSAGYTYDLSKRTNMYAVVSHTENFRGVEDLSSSVGMVGVRHRF